MNQTELQNSLMAIAEQLVSLAKAIQKTNDTPALNSPEQVAELVGKNLCLHCKKPIEPDEKKVRGLHERCRKAVKEVYPFDSEAVAAGVLLEESKGGRQPAKEKLELIEKKREAEQLVSEWKQKKELNSLKRKLR